jgi:hypothetical protein
MDTILSMSKKKVAVPIGIDFDTKLPVSINGLNRSKTGKKCNLYCPNNQCKAELKAVFSRTGKKVDFLSHINIVATLACAESALHLQGKMALLSLSEFTTCPHILFTENKAKDFLGRTHTLLGQSLFGQNPITFIAPPSLEQTIKDDVEIKGDVVVTCQYDNHPLDVNFEIKVTHAVDQEKLAKIKQLDITTIEIDISHLISLGMVTNKEVLEAVKQIANHEILHVNSTLVEKYKTAYRNSVKERIESANNEIMKRIGALERKWIANSLTLPQHRYRLSPLSDNVRVENLNISQTKPHLPIKVTVHSLKHEINNCFNLTFSLKNTKKVLPLYVRHKEHDLDDVRASKISFLYFDISSLLGHSLPAAVYWGFNVRAHDYQLAYNKQAAIVTAGIQQKELDYFDDQKRKAISISSDIYRRELQLTHGDYLHCPNESKIQDNVLDLMARIHKMKLPQEVIKELYSPYIDDKNVFGVISNVWQSYIIYYAADGGSLEDVPATINYLKKNGIDIVEPYKTGLINSKLFKEVGLPLPFKNPYLIISEYRMEKKQWLERLKSAIKRQAEDN